MRDDVAAWHAACAGLLYCPHDSCLCSVLILRSVDVLGCFEETVCRRFRLGLILGQYVRHMDHGLRHACQRYSVSIVPQGLIFDHISPVGYDA